MYEELEVDKYRSKPPSLLYSLTELPRTLVEMGSLAVTFPALASMPRGDGHSVMVLPGFMAGDESTIVLRRYLSGLGYNALPWDLGRNTGKAEIIEETLINRFKDLIDQYDGTISLIGQSLGGVYARELGRMFPAKVRQVITLGSPFGMSDAGGTNPLVNKLFERLAGMSVEDMRERVDMSDTSVTPPVPVTAIYSKADGVVNWEGCREADLDSQTQNIEVCGSHCGMAFNPSIYHIVADRLSQSSEDWQKYNRTPRGVFGVGF